MFKGTDLARAAGNAEHADALEAMLQQLLVVLVQRAGGSVDVSVQEIDTATVGMGLAMRLDPGPEPSFHFEVQRKH